jgi:hypothetical protein
MPRPPKKPRPGWVGCATAFSSPCRPGDPKWQLALHGLADGVEDVIVTIRRLRTHECLWRESMGTRPVETPILDDPNQNAMQQTVRGF